MSQVGQAVSQRRDSGMKSFFIIWVGQVISIVGSGLTGFALGVWMFERTGQATPFALTVLFFESARDPAGAVRGLYRRPVEPAMVDDLV